MKSKAILTISVLSAVLFAVSGCNTANNSLPPTEMSENTSDKYTYTESSDSITSEAGEKSNSSLYYSSVSDTSARSKGNSETSASSKNTGGSSASSSRNETPVSSKNTNGSSASSSRSEVSVSSKNNASGSTASPSRNETSVQRHTHKYSTTVYSPDCTNGGYTVHTCSCGKRYVDSYTNALGHSWGNWRTISEATTTQNGVQKRFCGKCNAEETRYTDKLTSSAITTINISGYAAKVVDLVNAERTKNNLKPFTIDNTLMKDAAVRSSELMTKFDHTRPNGIQGYEMAFDAGYMTVGENIASGQSSPEAVVKSWMNSPGHRANILNEDFTHIGVGCCRSESGRFYWTQLFGG